MTIAWDSERSSRVVPVGGTRGAATLWEAAGRVGSVGGVLPLPRRGGGVAGEARGGDGVRAELVVLASSSAGNCSALVLGEGRLRRVVLIDGGLSPRRTFRCLAGLGLGPEHLDRIVFTHLDRDHAHGGWVRSLPRHAEFVVHARHRSRGERMGMLVRRTSIYAEGFELAGGVVVRATMAAHDELGVAAFRIEVPGRAGAGEDGVRSLGYATDLGRVPDGLIEALRGVDVLAIESNYCPAMQSASDRPEFLKRRIMDGSGHLSNEQCVEATRAIGPRRGVVLLHLSRECNTPERASAGHAGAGYALSISDWAEPIPGVSV